MYSRYLDQIDAEIANTLDELSADCLRAKRAAYLIRQGYNDEAAVIVEQLHVRYDSKPNAKISSWLNLVEGLKFVFGGLEVAAFDKMQRALALATAANLPSMRSLCAGWLANLKFGLLEIKGMGDRLEEALYVARKFDHQALARAGLVCAVALHFANRYDLARPWYKAARSHAAEEADDATVSALMHNIACMGVANLRQATLAGMGSSQLEPNALLEAESTSSYDNLVGTLSVSAWVPILRAQAASLTNDSAQALHTYGQHIDVARQQGLSRVMCYMLADIAWCQLKVGQIELAESSAGAAEASIESTTLIDDRAATHSRLAAVFGALGNVENASKHDKLAAKDWFEFRQLQAAIVARVGHMTPR